MTNPFIQMAFQGKNNAWRYLIGSVLVLLSYVIIGGTLSYGLLIAYVLNDGNPSTRVLPPSEVVQGEPSIVGASPLELFVFLNLAFLAFLLSIYLVVRLLHGRSFLSLVTARARISWVRIGQGFSVFFILKVLEVGFSYWASPEEFTLNFQPRSFLFFLGWLLLLTPLQTAAEELFCRGYLLQGIGSKLGKWMGILLPSLLFTALHGMNPEVASQPGWEGIVSILGYYFLVGAFLAWITVKDQSLELALGVHAANNMATFLLVTSPDSVIPSPAVFSISKIEAGFTSLFLTAILLFVFSLVVFRVLRRPAIAQ